MNSWIHSHREGLQHSREFKIKEAKQAFDLSLQLSMATNHRQGIAANYIELGKLYLGAHEFETAEEYLTKALEITKQIPDRWLAAGCLQVMSDLELRQGRVDDAFDKCQRGRQLVVQDASPEDLRSFDTRIEMLTSKQDVNLVVCDVSVYRAGLGLQAEKTEGSSRSPQQPAKREPPKETFPVSMSLEGFRPPARFRDVVDAVVETWQRTDKELSQRYGNNWCILPDFENAVNADGPHDYVVAQLNRAKHSGHLMIGEGKASLMLLVHRDITQRDGGEEQSHIIDCVLRHWAEVINIPYKPARLSKMTLRGRDDGSMEVVKPGIQNLWLKLPIPETFRIHLVVPKIAAALQAAYEEISRFAGPAWCANWVHVLPPVLTGEAIRQFEQGRFPACILYPEEGYADLKLDVLEKVGDLEPLKKCIEIYWPYAPMDIRSRQGRMLNSIVGYSIAITIAAAAIVGVVTLVCWLISMFEE